MRIAKNLVLHPRRNDELKALACRLSSLRMQRFGVILDSDQAGAIWWDQIQQVAAAEGVEISFEDWHKIDRAESQEEMRL